MKLFLLPVKLILFFIFCFYSISIYAIELKCRYIHKIQNQYLESHINFSDLKKGTNTFKKKISSLETKVKNQLIKSLDPQKIYFTKSDVKNIKRELKNIFQKIENKNCTSLNRIYNIFEKKVAQQKKFVIQYLKTFILKPTIKIVLNPKYRERTQTLRQQKLFYEKYIQYEMSLAIIASDEEEYENKVKEAKKNILYAYNSFHKTLKTWSVNLTDKEKQKCYKQKKFFGQVVICKPDKWYFFYLNSFAKGLDPHSSYMSQEEVEDFFIHMKLSLEGIGATLSSKYGYTIIEGLVKGGAAELSHKIKVKDKILSVGKNTKEMVNIFGMDLRDIVSIIRGKKGTPVFLKIMRMSKGKQKKIFIVRLLRSRINLEEQAASVSYIKRKKNTIAILSIPSFYGNGQSGRSVTRDVKKILKQVKSKKVSAMVLDMSNNLGGSLPEAISLAGLFFEKGIVVRQLEKTRTGDYYRSLKDTDSSVQYKGPLVVLVNRVSASASEIVAGTLKSYKRSVIVGGDHTFGKGSIQSVSRVPMRGLGSIRVTIGLYFIPNGYSTQLQGVQSDISFPSIFSIDELGEKTLDYVLPQTKLVSFLSQQINTKKSWKSVDNTLIKFLKNKSQKRIQKDKKFKEIKKDIVELQNKKKYKYITTIAEIFDKAAKKEDKAAKKEDKVAKKEDKTAKKEVDKVKEDKPITTLEAKILRKKNYLKRPDIQEAINIANDQFYWQNRVKK